MRGTVLVLSLFLIVPVVGAWQLPEPQIHETEWVVVEEDGWVHSEWIALSDEGLRPLRQISETEVLVWGGHGAYQLGDESLLRGPTSDGYLVVLEPRLPSHAQLDIITRFDVKNLQLAGPQAVAPTSFEVYGIDPVVFDRVAGIWWVEPLLETKARNSVSSSIMEHGSMENHPAWDLGLNGTGVIVGVADSGIELDHGCFRENATSIGEIGIGHRKVVLVNTTIDDGDNPGQSDYRHGTHIAGTLGCDLWHGNVTNGTSPSHGAQILFQDIVNESGWSEPSVDWLLAEALATGAVIHSDSWGDDTEAYTLRSAEFDLWHREVPWSLAFIAPGNNPSKFYEPANARNVVSVGGTWTDNNSNLYSASSHGPTEEGLRGNFIVAPAMGIMSAAADGNVTSFNDDMRASTGTSMSTPLGASITAVIQQMVQDGWFTEDGFVPSAPMLRALLAMSAESMEGGQQGAETVGPAPDPLQGWGRPNLANLIDFNTNSSQNIWISDSYEMDEEQRMMLVESWLSSNGSRPLEQVLGTHWNGTNASGPFLKNGESVGFELDRAMGEDLDVFLSFNQRPFGTVSDDLDIVVVLPNGATFRSNEALEGTERLRIDSDILGSVESVWVEVRAIHIGVGNHTDTLGVDGDMLGFGLAVKGVVGGSNESDLYPCPDGSFVENSDQCDWGGDGGPQDDGGVTAGCYDPSTGFVVGSEECDEEGDDVPQSDGGLVTGCYNSLTGNWTDGEGAIWSLKGCLSFYWDPWYGCSNAALGIVTDEGRDVCESYIWATDDGVSVEPVVLGCTSDEYINYDPNATADDGTCGCLNVVDHECLPALGGSWDCLYGGVNCGGGTGPALLPPLDFSNTYLGPSLGEVLTYCCLPCGALLGLCSYLGMFGRGRGKNEGEGVTPKTKKKLPVPNEEAFVEWVNQRRNK